MMSCAHGILHARDIPKTAQRVDGVAAVVYSLKGIDVITRLDVIRPGLDGRVRTLDDIVMQRKMRRNAQDYHIEEDRDKVIKHLKIGNKVTEEELHKMFEQSGYSYEEGVEEFCIMSAANNVMGFKIGANLIVPNRDVVAYYNANPEIEEARYTIQRGFIPTSSALSDVVWGEPFTVLAEDIAKDRQFILELKPGEISEPLAVRGGFEVFKMVACVKERVRTLEERYKEISDILRQPRQKELMEEYKKELDAATVVELF
jgi:hypothetical protein